MWTTQGWKTKPSGGMSTWPRRTHPIPGNSGSDRHQLVSGQGHRQPRQPRRLGRRQRHRELDANPGSRCEGVRLRRRLVARVHRRLPGPVAGSDLPFDRRTRRCDHRRRALMRRGEPLWLSPGTKESGARVRAVQVASAPDRGSPATWLRPCGGRWREPCCPQRQDQLARQQPLDAPAGCTRRIARWLRCGCGPGTAYPTTHGISTLTSEPTRAITMRSDKTDCRSWRRCQTGRVCHCAMADSPLSVF